MTMRPISVVLAGAHGYGMTHLRNVRRLERLGAVRLVGVCDTRPASGPAGALAGDVEWSADLDGLLRRTSPQIVIVSTPIHTHVELAEQALLAGADVLLEKPPAPSLAGFQRLASVVRDTDRACQVGFQCLGSTAIDEIHRLIADGVLGRIRGIGVFGAWIRDAAYWSRAPWAGRRELDGHQVCDGAVTNPFAHAVAAALRIDGSDRLGDLHSVEPELFRANPIEADDTSCVRIVSARGTTIAVGVTLCAANERQPYVVVHGDRGRAIFRYQSNRLRVVTRGRTTETEHFVVDPLTDLAQHVRDRSHRIVTPLESTGAFTEVVEAVRLAPTPTEIAAEHQRVTGDGPRRRHIVTGAERQAQLVAEWLVTFSELSAPWIPATASR